MNTTAPISYGRIEATPLGHIWVAVSMRGLAAVRLGGSRKDFVADLVRRFNAAAVEVSGPGPEAASGALAKAMLEIGEYLQGERRAFSLPLDWTGMTPFQRQVLEATSKVPYGRTVTYSALADRVGKPRAARAVGRAEATNPIPLVLPCHRVVGSDGSLRGYAGPRGIETKAWLLQLEQDHA